MTRSSSRARTSERGFVLLSAIVLAVLYFALMELLLIDSARELHEAQRFRARVVAQALAENAAELAAERIAAGGGRPANEEDAQGTMTGRLTSRSGAQFAIETFTIEGVGATKGAVAQRARVIVHGEVDHTANPPSIRIDYTMHSQ